MGTELSHLSSNIGLAGGLWMLQGITDELWSHNLRTDNCGNSQVENEPEIKDILTVTKDTRPKVSEQNRRVSDRWILLSSNRLKSPVELIQTRQ